MKSLLVVSEGDEDKGITTAGATGYMWLGTGHTSWGLSEIGRQITYRTAGTFSKLYVRVTANSTNGNITILTRKNGANGGMSVTIGAGATGVFQDTTNTDTVTAGDKFNYQYVATGTTGTLTVSLISVLFDATKSTTKHIVQGYTLVASSTTHYLPIAGDRSGTTGTESAAESTVRKAGNVKNAMLHVSTNTRTTETTFTLRKNRTDTSIIMTVGAGATGVFEDTTHIESYTENDEWDWELTMLAGTESLAFQFITMEYESTTDTNVINGSSVGTTADLNVTNATTHYAAIGGGITSGPIEADFKLLTRVPLTLSNLTIRIGANTISAGTSTFRLRINGADGSQSVSIPAGATGFFIDTTNTDTVTATDEINYQIITGATGTTLRINNMAIYGAELAEPSAVIGSAGRSQGRSPLYRLTKPKVVAVIIRLKVQLEYEVIRLTITIAIPYVFEKVTLIKYASAVITPLVNVLPLRKRPTPKAVVRTIITQLPYEVQTLRLRSACAYEVDKLITRKKQIEILRIAMNYLISDFTSYTNR